MYGLSYNDDGQLLIKRNDEVLCTAYVRMDGGSGAYTSTCTAIVELLMTDSVRVTGNSDDPASIQATYSGFAGHLIEATESHV